LLEKIGEGGHGGLKVFGDFAELAQGPVPSRSLANGIFQAMVDVILDHRFLRLDDGLLDRMQLLRDVEAGASFFDHVANAA
jgi:hypothetical protein